MREDTEKLGNHHTQSNKLITNGIKQGEMITSDFLRDRRGRKNSTDLLSRHTSVLKIIQ